MFIIMMLVISVVIAISLVAADVYTNFGEAIRHASFQVVSISTTSGFATTDTNLWTPLAIVLLIFCSVICGCAGSTSGGMKVDRLLIAAKVIRNRMKIQLHPNAVIRTKMGGMVQEESTQNLVMTFIVSCSLNIVGVGLMAVRTVIGIPFEIPPFIPPLLLVAVTILPPSL